MGRTIGIHVMSDKFVPNFQRKYSRESLFERPSQNIIKTDPEGMRHKNVNMICPHRTGPSVKLL